MPSVSHEALVHLFRECPHLAAALLRMAAGIELPADALLRATSTTFSDLEPAEYRADAVLRVEDEQGQLLRLIIVEIQLAQEPDKHFSWPLYLVSLRARLRTSVNLLVFTLDHTVARWSAQPILLDDVGSVLQPSVIGPSAIPHITSTDEASAFPELAVLSVAAHGHGPQARELGVAALTACASLDNQRFTLYSDIIHAFLGEAARLVLEALMEQNPIPTSPLGDYIRKHIADGVERGLQEGLVQGRTQGLEQGLTQGLEQGLTQGLKHGLAQGLEQGRKEGLRAMLTRQIEQRFGMLSPEAMARLQAAEYEQLMGWAERVLTADSLAAVLADQG